MEQSEKVYKILVGKSEAKIPLGRARGRWEDIKIDLREVSCDAGDNRFCSRDQWLAYVRAVMNLRVTY